MKLFIKAIIFELPFFFFTPSSTTLFHLNSGTPAIAFCPFTDCLFTSNLFKNTPPVAAVSPCQCAPTPEPPALPPASGAARPGSVLTSGPGKEAIWSKLRFTLRAPTPRSNDTERRRDWETIHNIVCTELSGRCWARRATAALLWQPQPGESHRIPEPRQGHAGPQRPPAEPATRTATARHPPAATRRQSLKIKGWGFCAALRSVLFLTENNSAPTLADGRSSCHFAASLQVLIFKYQ